MHYTNPLYPHDFADPFAWHDGERYYAIGTGRGDPVQAAHGQGVFPLLQSDDLVHWRPAGRALARPDAALGDTFWAPEVAHGDDGRWYLYYSAGFGDKRHHLRVAVAPHPLGPYVDAAALTDPAEVPFAIDPHPVRGPDGRWVLFHARDFLDTGHAAAGQPAAAATHAAQPPAVRAGTALVVQPLDTMTRLAAVQPTTVARAGRDWQRFEAGRAMYGGVHDWHTLEGPCVVQQGGRWWCLYSGGNWQNDSYGVDHLSAPSLLGPWQDDGSDHGPRVLRTVPGRVLGPGHCSVVSRIGRPDERFIVYHAWGTDGQARRMCIDPLLFGPDGPRCDGPSFAPRTLPGACIRSPARG